MSRTPESKLEPELVQIAGIHDAAEAELVQSCGVHYLGFPLRLPVHQEDLSEIDAAGIIQGLRPGVHAVLITYLAEADTIADLCDALGVHVVQLHGDISMVELRRLRMNRPSLTVIKSLVVGLYPPVELEHLAAALESLVDGFITDTYAPETGASGATGRTHDWAVSRRLVQQSRRPVILAGGLTPANVRGAIVEVRPAGVDVHTGVEDATGRKSVDKVRAFVAEARAGFRQISVSSDN